MSGSAWFASDIHLNPSDPARQERFLRLLDAWERTDAALYVLGDLFDYWLGGGHAADGDYAPVLARLAALGKRGRSVGFLFGNRDFLIDRPSQAPTGLESLGHSAEIRLGGLNVFLCHGDRLVTRDRRYQRMRHVLQSSPVKGALRSLPIALKRRLALRMRGMSIGEIARKDPDILRIPESAVMPRFLAGADVVICGHIHKEEMRSISAGGRRCRLYTLKDWCDGSPFLEFDGQDFKFRAL